MARVEKTVFISYRRTDVYTALAVYQDLSSKGYDVFFDYTSISSGDFEQIILSNIRARAHCLLILTPTALDRVDEPGDWLRREIETAIDEQRNIVPLFFKGFNFGNPSVAGKLTGKLSALPRYNGMNVHEDYFPAAMDRLSAQFLNVPLSTILHPVSTEVRRVVREEQNAVNQALAEKWEELKELFKSSDEKKIRSEKDNSEASDIPALASPKSRLPNLRTYAIGGGLLLLVALAIVAMNGLFFHNTAEATATNPVATNSVGAQPSLTVPANTATIESSSSAATVEPTFTVTTGPTLGVMSTMISPNDGMTLMFVPAGKFKMGDKAEDLLAECKKERSDCQLDQFKNAEPIHEVYLDAFWIDKTEVTLRMYFLCVQAGGCDKEPENKASKTHPDYYGNVEFNNYPVINIDWEMANKYCKWAGRRLPTEAEWEKAARGENASAFPWGDAAPNDGLLNYYKSGVGDTTEVGIYPNGASPYGAMDMAGNVLEWVADWYDATYYAHSPPSNPPGPDPGPNLVRRIIRGGWWNNLTVYARSSYRTPILPDHADYGVGFRCAMSASQ